jgi:hypothetical protein
MLNTWSFEGLYKMKVQSDFALYQKLHETHFKWLYRGQSKIQYIE